MSFFIFIISDCHSAGAPDEGAGGRILGRTDEEEAGTDGRTDTEETGADGRADDSEDELVFGRAEVIIINMSSTVSVAPDRTPLFRDAGAGTVAGAAAFVLGLFRLLANSRKLSADILFLFFV